MAKQVANFSEMVSYLTSLNVEESEAIHIAESFMDAQKIQFDADGNFTAISIDYNASSKAISKA
jgi:hypothetical protein